MLEKYKTLSFTERIMTLRELFAKRQIRGTGEGRISRGNSEEDFEFLQLSDFLPEATLRCKDMGLLPIFSMQNNMAILTVYDQENFPNVKIEFTSPTTYIKTGHYGQELQGIGAQISYSRRYLWFVFLDLCTHDELDEGLYDKGLPQKRRKEEQKQAQQGQQDVDNGNQQNQQNQQTPQNNQNQQVPQNQQNMDNGEYHQNNHQNIQTNCDPAALNNYINNIPNMDRNGLMNVIGSVGIDIHAIEKFADKPMNEIDDAWLKRSLTGAIRNRLQMMNNQQN